MLIAALCAVVVPAVLGQAGGPAPGEEPRLLDYSDYYYDLYYGDYNYDAPGMCTLIVFYGVGLKINECCGPDAVLR
jgi:hypothetical protein